MGKSLEVMLCTTFNRYLIEFQALLLVPLEDLRLADRDIVLPIAWSRWNLMTQTGIVALDIATIGVVQRNCSSFRSSGF
jgi:hypothetical protein